MRNSLGILSAAAFVVAADARVLDPLLPVIAHDFRIGVGTAGMLVTAYAVPYGLFQLVYGPLGDAVGKLRVVGVAMALFALGTAGCAFVHDFTLLAVLRFATGAAAAAVIPLSLAYIADSYMYAERQAALGKYMGAVVFGQVLGSSLGGVFGESFGWRNVFVVLALASLAVATLFLSGAQALFLQSASMPKQTYWSLLAHSEARVVILAIFVEGFFFFGSFSYLGAFLRDTYFLSYVAIGLLLSGLGLGGLIYSVSVKALVQKLGESGLIAFGGALICASYLAIAFVRSWWLFVPLSVMMGLGLYMLHNTLQVRASELFPKARGTAVSMFAFAFFLGQGAGVAFFAPVVERFGYAPCFVLSGLAIVTLTSWLTGRFSAPVVTPHGL